MDRIVILMGALPYPRMYKRIQTEKKLGELHLICWDRGNNNLEKPVGDNYKVHLIQENAIDDPLKRLAPYTRVFKKAYNLLNKIQPKVIHVEGLDMLKIAVCYKKRKNPSVKIVFEVGDLHRLIVDKQRGIIRKAARLYLRTEDRRLSRFYDLLVITSEAFYTEYFSEFVKKNKVMYVPNAPEVTAFKTYQRKKEGPFTIGYIGSIRYKKQIHMLLEAAEKCKVNLVFAGFEQEPLEIQPICINRPNTVWLGRFDFEKKAADIYGMCDVVYSVYDADMSNVRVALPNKLYESIYCELPIIVAQNTYLASKTKEWGVGIAVSHTNTKDLIKAIEKLQDYAFYNGIVDNCKKRKKVLFAENSNEILARRIKSFLQD